MLSDKLTAARISERSQIRGIHVIDLANLPRQPSPRQPMSCFCSGWSAGRLGLGAATLREYMTQIVETEQEVTHATGLPVLGSIPMRSNPSLWSRGHARSYRPLRSERRPPLAAGRCFCRAIRTALDCQSLNRPLTEHC